MPASQTLPAASPVAPRLTAPVIDYEPPPLPLGIIPPATACPSEAGRHRHTSRRLRSTGTEPAAQLPAGAVQFADATLRRVLEVLDRRRPPAQLTTAMSRLVVDALVTAARVRPATTARLQRVRLRPVGAPGTAEVFATYTRGTRVRAIAGRIELLSGRWQFTALQVG